MKNLLITAAIVLAYSLSMQAQTTNPDWPFCDSLANIELAAEALYSEDSVTWGYLVSAGVCSTFNSEKTKVTVLDTYGWGAFVSFSVQGNRAFTLAEGILL